VPDHLFSNAVAPDGTHIFCSGKKTI
jgi:hypothetical protein